MSTCMRRLRCLLICHALALAACISAGDGAPPDAQLGATAQQDLVTGYTINPATGWADTGSTWTVGPSSVSGLGAWNVELSLPVGSTVPTISASIIDSTSSVVAMMLVSYVGSSFTVLGGSSFTVLGQATSNGTGAQTLTVATSHVVTSTESLVVRFTTPNSTKAPSITGLGVGVAAPTAPPPVTRLLFPPTTFVVDSSNLGFSYVSPVLVSGATIIGASVSVSCPLYGFIQTCARGHGGGAWNACSPAVACYGTATANLDMQSLHVTDTQQFDIGVYSSVSNNTPGIAVVSFF